MRDVFCFVLLRVIRVFRGFQNRLLPVIADSANCLLSFAKRNHEIHESHEKRD